MKYTPSVNIEQSIFSPESYIVTPNARSVVGNIINAFNSGIHSFNIIGSYGTGKSSFILALEYGLKNTNYSLIENKGQFNNLRDFRFLPITGDYNSLSLVVNNKIPHKHRSNNLFDFPIEFAS